MNKFKAASGFLLIFIFIYIRFLKERILGPINPQPSIGKIIGLILIISLYIYLIYRTLIPVKSENILQKITIKIAEIYKSLLLEAYITLNEILGKYYGIFLTQYFIPFWGNMHRQLHIYLIFFCKYFIPILIPIVFVIEVCIYKEIKYFPKIIILMFFYFLIDILWFISTHYANESLELYKKIFIIEEEKENGKKKITIKVNPNLSEIDYYNVSYKKNFEILAQEYIKIKNEYLPGFLNYPHLSNTKINKYKKSYLVIRYLLWIIGWITMLIYIINNN